MLLISSHHKVFVFSLRHCARMSSTLVAVFLVACTILLSPSLSPQSVDALPLSAFFSSYYSRLLPDYDDEPVQHTSNAEALVDITTSTTTNNSDYSGKVNKPSSIEPELNPSSTRTTLTATDATTTTTTSIIKGKCPPAEKIHPCTCQLVNPDEESSNEDDKVDPSWARVSSFLHSSTFQSTLDAVDINVPYETIGHCSNIHHSKVLHEAIGGFRGYHLDAFIIDSCIVPPFPNHLFSGLSVDWMEVINSPLQFAHAFFSHSSASD